VSRPLLIIEAPKEVILPHPERREIDLHRRVCVITPDVVDIRPARSAAIAPLFGFLLGVLCFVAVLFWIQSLPFPVVLLLMGAAIVLVPFSGMGFVYSIYGANVVVDRRKQTAIWQQGLFGMGVGTEELVPFAKIDRLEIERVGGAGRRGPGRDFVQFELSVLKKSAKTLPLGQVTVPPAYSNEGLARIREVADAIASMTGAQVELINVEDGPQHRPRSREPESNAAPGVHDRSPA
jgi:hypothetical protein